MSDRSDTDRLQREVGSEIRMPIENGDYSSTLERLAEFAGSELAILGEDYMATFKNNPEDGTISVWCEKKWWVSGFFGILDPQS